MEMGFLVARSNTHTHTLCGRGAREYSPKWSKMHMYQQPILHDSMKMSFFLSAPADAEPNELLTIVYFFEI